ncbi:low-complexity tail membrane protein [Aphanothece hegewaldii CCALA 016]|uniref:Low-complexity tail membrane protein n=1 Tax=Aphanothece hegewaldii CCALA 016 TaxID=2107694 RepID=A0A2T1M2M2_9CHRO|nr:low-complexity tail membrane protein [Aphanothece hegewaldii]PSF38982.1 low-complexity tail membrane protein [Aphanothece hegewaldii CCALA 016]
MSSFRSEPFLWIHLAGIAALPILLQIAWIGLAVGDPLPGYWLELIFLLVIAIAPISWMQWYKPFDIFSLLFVAQRPELLTPEQLKILSLFKRPKHRFITVLGTVLMIAGLWKIYQIAPIATPAAAFLPQWRIIGLLIASLAFLASHLFLQVPLSVLGVLFTKNEQWEKTEPIPVSNIAQSFTLLGIRVRKILPTLVS